MLSSDVKDEGPARYEVPMERNGLAQGQIETLLRGAEYKMAVAASLLTEASAYLLAAGRDRHANWCAIEAEQIDLRKKSEAEPCSPTATDCNSKS